jgi:hypothetical protein
MYSELLVKEVNRVLTSYGRIDFHNRLALLANLVFIYHAIKASSKLCYVAGELERDNDLSEYFFNHGHEEEGHDKWLAEDLATAGVSVNQTSIPSAVPEMVGGVYYLIYHVEPAALLGYMLVMESGALQEEQLTSLEETHGKELIRTLRYHSEHDPDHLDTLKFMIDSLPDHRKWIVSQTAVKAAHYIGRALSMVNYGKLQ